MLSMKLFSTKSILMAALMVSASAFADDAVAIRNVCDSLSGTINIKTAYIEVTDWFGSKDLNKVDSVKVTRHKDYTTVAPQHDFLTYPIPLSIPAKCAASAYQSYTYANWVKATPSYWEKITSNEDYSTIIYDVNYFDAVGDYNSSNSYNFLVLTDKTISDDDPSYSSSEMFVSKTFEFNFDWWFASVSYISKTTTTTTTNGSQTTTSVVHSYSLSGAMAMDSLKAVQNVIAAVPDTINDIELQIIHAVMMDESKIPSDKELFSSSSEALSSSSSETPSSSSEVLSSSSVAPSSSSDEVSSSSESISSSSEEKPSSSSAEEDITWIASLKAKTILLNPKREMRRLDGSHVKQNESIVPGVYYVKGVNGIWKKQLVLPR